VRSTTRRQLLKHGLVVLFLILAAPTTGKAVPVTSPSVVAEKPSPHPVLDSEVWAVWNTLPQHYWMDNHRVIFIGSKTRKKVGSTERQIQLWDTRTNKVAAYSDSAESVQLCQLRRIVQSTRIRTFSP
jgi:hypothetical protein